MSLRLNNIKSQYISIEG